MTKLELQSIIEKYHLDGLVENVKWVINKDKTLSIDFMSPSREMIGNVIALDFPLPESSIGISNTTQLDKLLSITSGTLVLDYAKEGKIIAKLLIADSQYNLNYSLADLLTVPKSGTYNGPEEYEVEAELNDEIITALIKAKNALSDCENVVVELVNDLSNGLQLEFTFNGDIEYANKITYTIPNIQAFTSKEFRLKYSSELVKQVLVNNKKAESGILSLNSNGLMKLEFKHNTSLQSKYYIVAKSE
jgi:hypothetical protein